jgi:hypothetical protein
MKEFIAKRRKQQHFHTIFFQMKKWFISSHPILIRFKMWLLRCQLADDDDHEIAALSMLSFWYPLPQLLGYH